MKDGLSSERIGFTLSESAREYFAKTLPGWIKQMSEKRQVPVLSYSGGGRCEKNGKIIWEYDGALFLLAGQRREALGNGKYFDLMRFPVWIGEIDELLLKGRVLTYIEVGGPEPEKHLVIENAPDNFFQTVLSENAGCCSRREPNLEHGAS